jgi:hypothetical protein
LREPSLYKYRLLLNRLKEFATAKGLTLLMVEAGGVETNSGTENAQLIDFSRRTKRQKLEKRGQLERIWNTASGCQNESLVDLLYLCFVPDWRAVAR